MELEKTGRYGIYLEVKPIGLVAKLIVGVERKELKISFNNLCIRRQDNGYPSKGQGRPQRGHSGYW